MTAAEPVTSVRVTYSAGVTADPNLDRAARAGTAILRQLIDGTEPDVPLAGGPLSAHWSAVTMPTGEPLALTLSQGETTLAGRLRPDDIDTGWGAFHIGLLVNQVLGGETRRAIRHLRTHPLPVEAE